MRKIFFATLAVSMLLISCNSKKTEALSGAGATFPAAFYNIAIKDYGTANSINATYGAIGSGGGIRSLKDKTVDFGGTDVFLSDKEMMDMNSDVIHIPTCLGAVVVSYNLKNIKEIKLNAELITAIYLGKITNWNDARIKAINPEINFPDKTITVVYRSDGSGTTAVFSGYMASVNKDWETAIGQGKSLKFPVGVAAKGNPGVAGVIAQTEGSIGYVGSEYALALNIPSALMQNSSGNYIKADTKSIAAAANIEMPADTRAVISNASNPDAYPISTFTWIIAYKEQNYNNRSEEQAKVLKKFLNYIIADGQAAAEKTYFAPLPVTTVQKAKAVLDGMTYNGHAIN